MLCCAAFLAHRQLLAVEELLAAGASLDLQSNGGNTALILAAKFGHTECVRALLAAGADQTLINADGKHAAMCAQDNAQHATAALLD